jgi:hypothetical protein
LSDNEGLGPFDHRRAVETACKLIKWGEHELSDFAERLVEAMNVPLEAVLPHLRSLYRTARDVGRDNGVDVSACHDDLSLDAVFAGIIAKAMQEEAAKQPTEEDLRALMGLALTAPTPDAIINFTGFVARMRKLAPFNVQMVYAQRPGARRVASRKEWEDIGRQVRPGAIPIVVLRTMGPIEYVFEELDTDPPIERQPESDVFAATGEFDKARLDKLIKALAAPTKRHLRVRVHRVLLGANLAGWVNGQPFPKNSPEPLVEWGKPDKGDTGASVWDISINGNLKPAEQFVTLLHELGHLFCGHVGPFRDSNVAADEYGWPNRWDLPKAAKEIEAELVAWWLANREGLTELLPVSWALR